LDKNIQVKENDTLEIIIEAKRTEKNYWRDIFHYYQLFFFLAWKEFLIRYKQTVMGVSWSVVRPILTMIVFTFIFGNIAKLPSSGVPYPILVYCGLLPWQFFAEALSQSSNSLVGNSNLISKVYFPRVIIPASSIMVTMIDFAISFAILIVLMIIFGFVPSINILFLPVLLLQTIYTSYSIGIFLAALNVRYRDIRYIVPFIVQFGLYISPVGFSAKLIPEKWALLYACNPMVGIIDGFRWALIGGEYKLNIKHILISIVISTIILLVAIKYFRKTEKTFADII